MGLGLYNSCVHLGALKNCRGILPGGIGKIDYKVGVDLEMFDAERLVM